MTGPTANEETLLNAIRVAADRFDRLADGRYMTEWSRAGDQQETRYRMQYAATARDDLRRLLDANQPKGSPDE